MPELKDRPQLKDYQEYVAELERERGFEEQSARDKCLLLGEEVGELFKAVRKAEGIRIDPASRVSELEGELADIFIYLCAIANRFDIDLKAAFLKKEAKNKKRTWVKA
ncbi:MAG: MazG nucleotide pyrophosphohydrolase domain-containing protein [Calditrichia bacterium]